MLESCGRQFRYASGPVMTIKMGMLWEPSKCFVMFGHLQLRDGMCEIYSWESIAFQHNCDNYALLIMLCSR